MSKQSFTTGQVLTAAQVNSLQANDYNQTVSVKTASYVLVAADKGTRIEFNTSGSVTCTVNSGLFDAGDTLVIQNRGAGTATVTAGTATVNTSASLAISQYGQGILYFVDNTSAIFFAGAPGDITGVTTGATSGLTGGVTSGTADLKLNFASKGQLAVGTGSGTTDFLNVGTNGYTLVADSAQTTGLKWATPAGGGGLTVLESGSLTGSSVTTATLSTSYNDLRIVFRNYKPATDGADLLIRFNEDTGTNYTDRTSSGDKPFDRTSHNENFVLQDNSTATGLAIVEVPDYANTTTLKVLWRKFQSANLSSNTANMYMIAPNISTYNSTSAITKLTFFPSSGNFTSGDYIVYGVK